jgi:archaemetzincin
MGDTAGEILLVPVGEVEAKVLTYLCAALTEAFGRPCRVDDTLPVPKDAFNPRRRQYSADAILQRVRTGQVERGLGVVDLDLYVPQLNFVFGLADRGGRRAVIALPRLREGFYGAADDEALFLGRTVKEAVHELGHTYGLSHCRDPRCVMAFSNSLADTDYKGQTFCPRCGRQLRARE